MTEEIQPVGPFEQIIQGDETFGKLYRTITNKLQNVEGISTDILVALQQKVLEGGDVSIEGLAIYGSSTILLISETRKLIETYIQLLRAMADLSKTNSIGIIGNNVSVGFGVPMVEQLAHIDPFTKSKEIKVKAEVVSDGQKDENVTSSNSTDVG